MLVLVFRLVYGFMVEVEVKVKHIVMAMATVGYSSGCAGRCVVLVRMGQEIEPV